MVGQHTILHIVELLAAVVCAHHFWPKGITYGEQEDWEKKLHKKAHRVKSRVKSRANRGERERGGGREHGRVRKRHRETRYYDDDEVRGGGERRAYGYEEERGYGNRGYEYEDRPPRYEKTGARSVY
ncbi:hypothetical protein LHYA1_G001800 [Lachnellula hyalina]|uniref:Uncharacterized protein n=1 Tax=Lachnellula hyalina TaxID=1316788 RepID=A0A8H8R8W8_9HELO|nr:uncharacterized protein LHYA1_G001800 [Lachnellula hyalina]TVY29841.1 hypothetical protein LHYA1_G001800 [Lachnellula hyalina]